MRIRGRTGITPAVTGARRRSIFAATLRAVVTRTPLFATQPSDWSGLTGVPPGGSGATCGASVPLRGGGDGGGAAPFSPVPGFGCGSAAEGGFGAWFGDALALLGD